MGTTRERPQREFEKRSGKRRAQFWCEFWAKVDDVGGCWRWRNGTDAKGRGVLALADGGRVQASKVAWAYDGRELVEGATLAPSCRRKTCIKPAHQVVR